MIIDLVSAFYGPLHARLFREFLIPSLEQQSNIPALRAAGHEINHWVYCTKDEAGELPRLPSATRTLIDTTMLYECEPFTRRDKIHLAFKRAIFRENLTIVAQPDLIFGNGLADAISDLTPGDYLVCPHPRIELEKADQLIPWAFQRTTSNEDWVSLFMDECPHSIVKRGINAPEAYWRTFRRDGHWETYFQEPPPLAFVGTPDMLSVWTDETKANLEVLDHELPEFCFQRGRLKSVMDSRAFIWAELTPADSYPKGIPARFEHFASCQYFNKTSALWYFK